MAAGFGLGSVLARDSDPLPGGTAVSSTNTGSPGGGPTPRGSWWARLKPRLGRKEWAGIGAIATILGVAITIAAILTGSGGGSVNSNNGPCSGVGNGNSVVCTGVGTGGTGAGTSP